MSVYYRIQNADTLINGAEDLVALSNAAFEISDGIAELTDLDESDPNYYQKRGAAIAKISTNLFSSGSTITSHIPGIVGDAVSSILSTAADTWTIVNKVDRKIKKAIQIGQEPKGY